MNLRQLFLCDENEARRNWTRTKSTKVPGSDGIEGFLLKSRGDELCAVTCHLLNISDSAVFQKHGFHATLRQFPSRKPCGNDLHIGCCHFHQRFSKKWFGSTLCKMMLLTRKAYERDLGSVGWKTLDRTFCTMMG